MIDWEKPLEWSNGEPANLSGDWQHTDHTKHVTACAPWIDDTGESYVHVSAATGEILGCEGLYPTIRNP